MAEPVEDIPVEEPEAEVEVPKKSKKKDKQDRANYPLKVNYCGVCSMPFEYCEYLADYDKCKRWWEEHFPDFFERAMKIGDGVDGEGDDPKKRQKRGGRGVIKAKKQVEKSKISVGRVTRNKKKFVTVVKGLETHGVSLKEAAKLFGRHFSCGSSVSGDEIVIQGDFVEDVMVLLVEKYPEIEEDDIEDIGKQKR
ncbi:density-regulated protein homolog [Strongylocentrotus purpuratus]|uniref:SUI1 domain-containing protein n=1 Tax=Strongylocentrotus purpuratus TaxID=7668 RepID=A0A7M7GJD9_STRPU|nr:density-regulated protein homolog [Strongylocentrotus purpuratus]|eukprot:XP_003727531.1 PREDICTED: density-regulated protein homolog [Strongylocentrotus purpuratus]